MCKAMERFRSEGKAEGIGEGEARGKREGKREAMLAMAKRMLADGVLALRDIARYSGLSLARAGQEAPGVRCVSVATPPVGQTV